MTADATNFISPLTLSTLSKNPVLINYSKPETGEWNNHVELALWANYFVIAPVSANTLGKMANGICDNLLLATYLSAKSKVYFAPAMDLDMWNHPATKANITKLLSYSNILISPGEGELASGLVGEGRMAEPEVIINHLINDIKRNLRLFSYKVLVTAGPTYEAIDPVRFIGNHSSGKMGFAIADELTSLGANVTLITGPTNQISIQQGIERINVTTANEMYNACMLNFKRFDACIMSAAVADYTPLKVENIKIKKKEASFTIELKKTEDILYSLGKLKSKNQILVGFALETNDEENYAIEKLKNKNLDFIVLNSLNDEGAGFKKSTNKITIIDNNLNKTVFITKSKEDVAKDICQKLIETINK
jgi:phosphopantothenoylcysteine decarboxylase/phosphopantothenate--cysteine ligase